MKKDELLDIVDVNGNVIGCRGRKECHSNRSLIHPTVHFTLFNRDDNSVLMTVRGLGMEYDPGKHIFLGEHMVSGETFEEGLVRGVKEELSLVVKDYVFVGTHIFEYDSQTEYAKMFLVFSDGSGMNVDKREIEGTFWLNASDISKYNDNVGDITKYWLENIDWENV